MKSLPRGLTCPSRLSISCNAPAFRYQGTYLPFANTGGFPPAGSGLPERIRYHRWKPAAVSTASCAGISTLRHGIFVFTTLPDGPAPSAFSYCSRLTDSSPIKLQHPVAQVRRSCAIGSSFLRGLVELGRVASGARSPKVPYPFAAAVMTIPVPAQVVHRILLPDDRSFTFPVP